MKLKPAGRIHPLATVLAALVLLGACAKEETPPPQAEPAAKAAPEPVPFVPPENGLVTEDQVKGFLLAHAAMIDINNLYLDSLADSALSPEKQRSVTQAMDIAREKVSRNFGLNGYAEYRWILEEAPKVSENARVFEQMQVTTVIP